MRQIARGFTAAAVGVEADSADKLFRKLKFQGFEEMRSMGTPVMFRLVVQRKQGFQIEPAEVRDFVFGRQAIFAGGIAGKARFQRGAEFARQTAKLPIRGGHGFLAAARRRQKGESGDTKHPRPRASMPASRRSLSQSPRTGSSRCTARRN